MFATRSFRLVLTEWSGEMSVQRVLLIVRRFRFNDNLGGKLVQDYLGLETVELVELIF